MKQLVKFIDANNKLPIYIDLDAITGVGNLDSTVNVNLSIVPGIQKCTVIYTSGYCFYVVEHISEVLALLEDRDPSPARVLFGKKNE